MSEPTVHIIDDDHSARAGLTRLLHALGMTTKSYASATEFLASGGRGGPGCILLDLQMPEVTGAELHEKLSSWEYSMPVIFLSAYGDVPAAAKAMKRGAVDFLTKPVDRADLNDAIRAALALDADNRRGLTISGVSRKLVARLTQREHEVMTYVIAGWRNKAVAKELGIAEDTVKVHRRRVMRKLEVDSVAELVRVCERAGIGPAQAHE